MTVVDNYLKDVPEPQRAALERIRKIVKQTAPQAEEAITYGMPGFKYKGKYLIAFGAFKDHLSIFPGSEAAAPLMDKLKDYKKSKGAIQFTPDTPIPEATLAEIVQNRIAAISKGTRY